MTTIPGDQAPLQPSTKPRELPNIVQRLITVVVLIPVVVGLMVIGGWAFALMAGSLAVIGVLEFCVLGRERDIQGVSPAAAVMAVGVLASFVLGVGAFSPLIILAGTLLAFVIETIRHPGETQRSSLRALVTAAAVIYVALPTGFLIALRGMSDGLLWTLAVMVLTWGTDTFAYVGGRLWGRTKLAPTISPKKTLEGAMAGVVGGILPAALLLGLYGRLSLAAWVLLGAGPLLAILGDLVESGLKRALHVKDSHMVGFDVLPGHGGVLDRVDGLIVVATVSYFYLILTGLAH